MKKLVLLSTAIILFGVLKSQFYDWSEPVALTDSLSYNTNPVVLPLNGSTYMFYEKKWDSTSPTMIYYRDVENMTEEQDLFSDPVVEYRNPRLISIINPHDDFLIYESNSDGNFNIYAIEILNDGSFGNIIQLTETNSDENSTSSNYSDIICWEVNNDIYISKLELQDDSLFLDNITLIDTNNCFEPVCSHDIIGYRKIINDSSYIFYAEYDSYPFTWSAPIPLDTTGNCCNLSIPQNGNECGCLFWDKNGLLFCYCYEIEQIEVYGSQFVEMYEPYAFLYSLPEKYIPEAYITFTSNIDGNNDVFAFFNVSGIADEPENISDNYLNNSSPRLFFGWETGDPCELYLLDIWDTQVIPGGKALYLSSTILWTCGAIEEYNQNRTSLLKLNPNPFSNLINIEFYQTDGNPVNIEIYSITGIQVAKFDITSPGFGWNKITWQPKKQVNKGIFNVVLRQGGIIKEVKKIIYN